VAIAAVVAFVHVGHGAADDVPPVVEEIDAAVVERDPPADPGVLGPSSPIMGDGIDAAVAGRVIADLERSPAQIVQDEIGNEHAELEVETAEVPQRPAYLMIQDAIDAGLEERRARQAEASSR
jgi:hypothetical protein